MDQTARIIAKEYSDHTLLNEVSDLLQWCEETAEAI
jgi:hypothetical protein